MRWSRLLAPVTPLYGAAVRLRATAYRRGWCATVAAPVPVVSVGNLTFGGTGKTPTTAALVRDLVRRGRRPAILSRGYGRAGDRPEVVLGPEPHLGPSQVGDEPLELALRLPGIPVVVDADRSRGAVLAADHGADVVILDDGFQYLRLGRDLDLVLVDAGDPFGGGRLPPSGRLREPVAALRRADAVLVTKLESPDDPAWPRLRHEIRRLCGDVPVAGARLVATRLRTPDGPAEPEVLAGAPVVAFAGIGRPAGFLAMLRRAGARVVGERWFPDHHRYRPEEVEAVVELARRHGAVPLTTAKDAVKITDPRAWVVEVEMEPLEGDWQWLWSLAPELAP